jgi:DNA-binding transcriptional LysR family regulator
MSIATWDEIRTAFHVALAGTVSGAAEALGVHHATVIRHVDALEARLGVKLFQRHARGYTATEAGLDLFQVAQATDDQFAQLVGRIRGRGDAVTGELVVTSLALLAPRMVPSLARFRGDHPDVIVRYLTGERLFRLEYGEAHVAVRAGPPPGEPDNVVQAFGHHNVALYGSKEYLSRRTPPETIGDLVRHDFVSLDGVESRAPFIRWLNEHVAPDQIVFRTSDHASLRDAVLAGVGLGFVARWDAERFPTLVPVMDEREEWKAPLWLVTHVDLHRTTKVQAFLKFLKEDAKDW